MIIKGTNRTARQAAKEFIRRSYPDRRIGTWIINPPRFQLSHGMRWYVVSLLPDYSGWEVLPESLVESEVS